MEKILAPHGGGKTTDLIGMADITKNPGYYIVCFDKKEARRILALSIQRKTQINFPITYQEFIEKEYYAKGIDGFLIDNLEDLIQKISDVKIKAITMTVEKKNDRPIFG